MTLLAKSAGENGAPETLFDHLWLVVEMSRDLFSRLPASAEFDADLLRDLEAAAAVHDIGKAATGFQAMLLQRQPRWNGWRHEVLSAAFASAFGLPEEVVFAVLTHHKRIPDEQGLERHGRLSFFGGLPEDWEPMRKEFEENFPAVRELWSELVPRLARIDMSKVVDSPLSGMFLNAAWRRPSLQKRAIPAVKRKRASLIRGLLMSADHLASGKVDLPVVIDLKTFQLKAGFSLRPFQQRAAIAENVILRAPTGSGKTEAALMWAGFNQPRNGRLFYTLPYTAALNAMHSRLQGEFPQQKQSIGLLHGRAAHHLFDAMQQDFPNNPVAATLEAKARARLAREIYHPVRVCTPHQLLRYTLRGKGWEQILSEIPGACVVFDEVHSYDPALAGLTLGTARLFHELGAKLMFISATLPSFLEIIVRGLFPCTVIVPDEKCEADREVMDRKRHLVRIEDRTLIELLPSILDDARSGKSVLVVCNHVRSAQTVAREIRNQLGIEAVCLFHGRFNMEDRKKIERRLASGVLPRVLVATQVVEVSLDISFQTGYFEAAPVDALAQRMGRVNRTPKPDTPPVNVIIANPLSPHELYDGDRTHDTLAMLDQLHDAISEQDIVRICDKVYENGYSGNDMLEFQERLDHKFFTQFDATLVAGDHQNWTEQVIDVANRADVLPIDLLSRYNKLIHERRWLEADALTVSIRLNKKLIDKYVKRGDHPDDPWIIDLPYNDDGLQPP